MSVFDIIFYLFAAVTVVSAFFVVTTRNIVHSAFYLLFTFFGVAGLYVLLGSDFLAIVQLVIYVGGILILLIFGVMLTNKITNVEIKTGTMQILPAAVGVGLFAGIVAAALLKTNWITINNDVPSSSARFIGSMLIIDYVVIFELLGIVLLVALIGAASIARK
ncbi:MAG: NADH-quinone oxidoreductase subunit J [Ignavibacteriales bacterium]|jgi:NADH-quinone oxidoreductase subunit J|nr:NADH-quinone oxidoreductase subunit J [Ignavibacteriales bacterium]MBK7377734.1 NADH-quinone oxidoreductase subunit J [Ignavibacteriales bacterium]